MPASRIELFNGKYIDDQMGNGVPEGGTTGQVLAKASNDDYDTQWVTGGGGGSGTVTSIATTSPLTGGTITTSGTIGISQATTSTDGYLSSTDWNTFNGKFNLPSLTAGSVLFSNGTTIAQDNANFFWDDTNNRLGIGTNTPARPLDVIGQIAATGNVYAPNFYTPNAGLENEAVGGGASYFKVYTNIDNRPVYLASNNNNILAVNSYAANSYKGVGISDGGSPAAIINNSSILLGLDSTTRGFLLPSLTTTQRNAITTPSTGLQIYNNTTNKISYYNGSSWIELGSGSGTVTSVGAGTGMSFTAITNTGNVDIDTAKVPYYASAPSNGLLKYTSGTWGVDTNTYLTTISGITAGGDLQGTYPNPTVHQIQGQSVQNGAPTNQDLLIWDNSASMWKHQQISTITGYNNTSWDTAYTNRITSLTTTGSSGSATLSSNTLNVPTYTLSGLGGQPLATNLTSLAGLSYASASFVKMSAAGTFSLDTNTYLTSVGTGTINELTYWSGANTLGSLTTGTYPSLAELSYVKGTTSAIQTQLGAKQDLSLSAYTVRANNTNATANATDQTFKDFTTATYSGSATWTGTTPPSGATTHTFRWTQLGKLVTVNVQLIYATTGSALTAVVMDLPSACPTPLTPTGISGNSRILYYGSGNFTGNGLIGAAASRAGLIINATSTGYSLQIISGSGSPNSASITVQYYTA